MIIRCLRWGRSAYERDADLQNEAEILKTLGVEVIYDTSQTPDLKGIDIIVVHSKKRVTSEVFEECKQLSLVITTTSGFDHIDLKAAYEHDVLVARSPMARRDAVVDTTLAMGLSLLRDLPYFQSQAQQGDWARAKLPQRPITLLRGLRVGIVGMGVIGQYADAIWHALGAVVRHYDPLMPETSTPLEELASWAQLLTLHCSLTESSYKLVDKALLQHMPQGAILLNTARGKCVDLEALQEASHLGGVGLDVFPQEPCPELAALAARPNWWITPHAAGYHERLGHAITDEVITTIRAWKQGLPLPNEVRHQTQ